MQQLYHIEARLREARAGPQEVLQARQQHSAPIMERLAQRFEELHRSGKHRPRSLTGDAIRYARNQWNKLGAFLRDGRVQMGNNLVENAIRPSAIGKRNWLFMGDAAAGDRAATFYTLIENCRRLRLDAYTYLCDLLTRLPRITNKQIKDVTSSAWAKVQ